MAYQFISIIHLSHGGDFHSAKDSIDNAWEALQNPIHGIVLLGLGSTSGLSGTTQVLQKPFHLVMAELLELLFASVLSRAGVHISEVYLLSAPAAKKC